LKTKLIIVLFLLQHLCLPVDAQKFCLDCSDDSVQQLMRNARTPEDTLRAVVAILDINNMSASDPEQVIDLTNLLIRLNKRIKIISDKPYTLYREATLLWHRNEKLKSIEIIKKAIIECDKENYIFGIASWLSGVRIFYNLSGLSEEKLKYYQERLKYYQENGPVENTAICYHGIASYYFHKADYNNAISYILKAAEVFQSFSPMGYANEIAVAGYYYYNWGNYERAQYYLQRGFELNLEIKCWSTAIYAKKGLALIEKERKNYKGALLNVEEMLTILTTHCTSEKYYKALALAEKGGILLELYRGDEAYRVLLESVKLRDSMAMPIVTNYGNFEGEYNLYKYFQSRGDKTTAENQLLSAYNKVTELKSVGLILKYRKELAAFYAETGKPEKAIPFALSYITTSDSLREMQNSYNIAHYENEQKDLNAFKELQRQKILRNSFVTGFAVVLLFAGVFFTQRNKIKKGKKRSDELLLNILPGEVAEELKAKGSADAKQFDEVTVMFTDFKGFTQISEKLTPTELVTEIDTCFRAFDEIITKHNIEKIKTIGDSYMCAGGLPVPNKTNATDVINAAIEIRDFMLNKRSGNNHSGFEIRIGVHTGPVVAGIVGIKKFAYDIWGDTVNIASRMESSGEAGKVNISGTTYALVKEQFECCHRGKIQAKNKGEVDMYFVENS
jgi:class 3 adenylate cyclase/tetratricopeptide (TPR) repeat protein